MENFDSDSLQNGIPERNVRTLLAREGDTKEMLLWLEEHAHAAAARYLISGAGSEIAFPSCLADCRATDTDPCAPTRNVAERVSRSAQINALRTAYAAFFADACRKDRSFSLSAWTEDPGSGQGERFVYVRTLVCDRAYTVFSSSCRQPTVSYVDTFEDACGALYNAQADFAILPIFGSRGESVRKVWNALERYELHIVRCVRLSVGEEGEEWIYALLSRGLFPFGEKKKGRLSVALTLHPEQSGDMAAVFSCFAALGFQMDFTEGIKDAYDRPFFRCVVSNGDPDVLLAFLTLERCGFYLTGVFSTECEKNK